MAADDPVTGVWAYYSLDIAGSTLLKLERPREWPQLIIRFLTMAPLLLDSAWSDNRAVFDAGLEERGSEFRLDEQTKAPGRWKMLGDEVIFVQEFAGPNPAEFLYSVRVFVAVLRDLRKRLRAQNAWSCELKGTVWLANEARNIRVNPEGEKDYLGPGVDVGFRLKSYAGLKQIALSIEAAYLLARGLKAANDEEAIGLVNDGLPGRGITAPVIYLAGEVLPGLFLPEVAYPKILLRILPWEDSGHRRLINKRGPVSASDLENTCLEWIRDQKERLFDPFSAEAPTGAILSREDSRAQDYNTGPLQ